MTLRREELTEQWVEYFSSRIREEGEFEPMTDAERAESLGAVLAAVPEGQDVWLFGYGSLMWNPLIHYAERREGRIHGYHRRYCLWLRWARATEGRPGLMLGLDRGGSCRGVAFRIPRALAARELGLIWMREMISTVYRPRWVTVRCGKRGAGGAAAQGGPGAIRAITFTVDPAHPLYTGRLSPQRTAELIAQAGGWLGSCRDYLHNTVTHLNELGVRDSYLSRVHALVERLPPAQPAEQGRPDLASPSRQR